MDYAALQKELQADAATLGLPQLSDQDAADRLNAVDTGRTRPRSETPMGEALAFVDLNDYLALSPAQQQYLSFLASGPTLTLYHTPVPGGPAQPTPSLAALLALFDEKTPTGQAIRSLDTVPVSRAEELGLPPVTALDVARAREGVW